MDKKEERFLIELDRRRKLWEGKKASAERRVDLDNKVIPLARIDIEVAERALAKIAKKKDEILGVNEETRIDYTDPVEVQALKKRVRKKAKAVFALAEKDEEPIVEVPKKRVLKKLEAPFAYVEGRDDSETTAKDEKGERVHSHPKGTFGKMEEMINGGSKKDE